MIDHRLGGGRQDVGMVLEKPASAGFLLCAEKSGGHPALPSTPSRNAAAASAAQRLRSHNLLSAGPVRRA